MLGDRAPLDGCVLAKSLLMPDPQYRLLFQFAGPSGDRFVVSDNQVVIFDIESPHIANVLPIAIGHDGPSVSKPAGLCEKEAARRDVGSPRTAPCQTGAFAVELKTTK